MRDAIFQPPAILQILLVPKGAWNSYCAVAAGFSYTLLRVMAENTFRRGDSHSRRRVPVDGAAMKWTLVGPARLERATLSLEEGEYSENKEHMRQRRWILAI